jgi:hypothetical protein
MACSWVYEVFLPSGTAVAHCQLSVLFSDPVRRLHLSPRPCATITVAVCFLMAGNTSAAADIVAVVAVE